MMGNKVCIDGVWYCLNKETKKATVTYSDDEEETYQGEVVIPWIVVYGCEIYIVKEIKDYAFVDCSSLTSITIPESVTKIGNSAFEGCSGLTSITIPESVTEIGCDAFYNCTSLATVILGNGVTIIGDDAFWGCSALKNVYCHATTPPEIGTGPYPTFEYYGNTTTLHVPSGCVADYQSSDWGEFFPNIKEMGSG